MKHETIVSVDEATKQFMGFINEDICATINDGINGALRKTNSDLMEVSEKGNSILLTVKGVSKTVDNFQAAIEQVQNKTEQVIVSEYQKIQQSHKETADNIKTAILAEQNKVLEEVAKLNDTYIKNQGDILNRIVAFEEKLSIVNSAVEGQALLLERLERIEEKITYQNLPFYKRWFNKGVKK